MGRQTARTAHTARLSATRVAVAVGLMAAGVLAVSPANPVAALGECGVEDPVQNVYIGPDNGSWTATANWSQNELPADGNICVPGGTIVSVPGGTYMVNHAVGQFATLRVAGTIRIADDSADVVFASIYGGTNMEISGRIEVSDGATFHLNPDQNGAPAFQLGAGGVIAVSEGSNANLTRALVNKGTIALSSGGSFNVDTGGAYSGSGNVTGGRLRVRGGTITFGASGKTLASVRSGTVRGTINKNSVLDLRCDTFSTAPTINGVTNRGTVEILPPVAGECSTGQTLSAGSTFRNEGMMTVGSRSKTLGWSFYVSNVYDQGGTFVNTGTLRVEDTWSANFATFTNRGVIKVGPKGNFGRSGVPTTNSGRIIARGTLELSNLTTSGFIELYRPTPLQGTLTMTRTSNLKVHASKNSLSSFSSVFTGSKLDGTLTVVTAKTSKPPKGWQRGFIVAAAGVTGKFDTVNGNIPGTKNKYKVIYLSPIGSIDLRVVAR